MKVIKPNELSVVTRCFEHQRRYFFGISALAFVSLTGEFALIPEAELWKFVPTRLPDGALDAGVPKARAEFLVDGSAFAPGGAAVQVCKVRARVGELDKQLVVSGDRVWRGQQPTAAQPFTTMRLSWARAFGGPSYPENPTGIGADEQTIAGFQGRWVPNIESPREPIHSPRQRPVEPAGFSSVDLGSPRRRQLAGTYDQRWLETGFPGLANDAQWELFNIAPRDQWGPQVWPRALSFELDNLHPSKPRIAGRLPDVRARAFLTRVREPKLEATPALEEVGLHLQTLWLFPDVERAVMIFHGSTTIASDDASDIAHLVVAAEAPELGKPLAHYQAALERRLDKPNAAIAALAVEDLLPEGLVELPPLEPGPERADDEGLLHANLHRKTLREVEIAREKVASYGLDPDLHGPLVPPPPLPPPKLKDLPKLADEVRASAEAMRVQQKAALEARLIEIYAMVDELAIPGFTSKTLAAELVPPSGPPRYSANKQIADLRKLASEGRATGHPIDEIEQMLVDDKLHAQWRQAEAQTRDAYRLSAHMQEPAPALDPEASKLARERLTAALAAGEPLRHVDFTGADLRGLDLRGADLRGIWFDSVRLDGVDLRETKLDEAVLAHADLRGARLDGASLVATNLGSADLRAAKLVRADLRESILAAAKLDEAVLDGADLRDANLMDASFVGCSAREIQASGLVLMQTNLAGIDLSGALLTKANFVEIDFTGANLAGAQLEAATFVTCKADQVGFAGARLVQARFVKDCTLRAANFAGATMTACNLRMCGLAGADFRAASLVGADLSECDAKTANFQRADAREARFVKIDAREASFLAANLMGAMFTGADIRGVDFRGANLHGADLARVRSDERVRLDDALLTKVRIHPRLAQDSETTG